MGVGPVSKWYIIEDVNPQPWAVGPLGVSKRAGKYIPFMGPNKQLVAFQNAVREELADFALPDYRGELQLDFFLWRRIEEYGNVRRIFSHRADATNIQKALEDALQGVLFVNDSQVRSVRTVVVEQSQMTRPRIVMRVAPFEAFDPDLIPQHIWNAIDKTPELSMADNSWGSNEEVF